MTPEKVYGSGDGCARTFLAIHNSSLRERIFEPLNLENTLLPEPGDTSIPGIHARGYVAGEMLGMSGELLDFTYVDGSFVGGSGGSSLVSTTSNLARFIDALMAGELFQNEGTLAEMVVFNEALDFGGQVGYGLGLERFVLPSGVEFYGHGGGAPGYYSTVGYLPVEDITFVMSSNAFPPDEYSVTWYISFLEALISELSTTEGQ
jgi:D-alanyl-D-alanine carboxypeptidase